LITGGARGIGFGIASCFAKQNATLVIADIQETLAQEACEQLKEIGAADALGIACDIAERAQVETTVKTAIEKFGRIDVLVNNAGISPFINVMDLSPKTFHKVLDVNLTGGFYCTQVVAKHMIERAANGDGGGRIIFISSLAPHFSQPSQVEYSASKAGVEGLMRGFSTALGPHGITSNAIEPGMILTPLTESHWIQPEPAEQIKKLVPVGRIGTPEDIGNVAVFLASPQAAYVNGAAILVDGGFSVLIKG
jgi:NAD(P)-dependent dehydrogenase (short-subunit alcohol dehydrogenase family)